MAGKLLILSVSAGYGHIVASNALADAAGRCFPDYEVMCVDILDIMPFYAALCYRTGYNFVVKYLPFIWKYSYRFTDHSGGDNFLTKLRKKIERTSSGKLLKLILDYEPDEIICTHFLPAQIVQYWKNEGKLDSRVWEVITDYVSHRFWHVKGISGFFTATEEGRRHLIACGHREPVYVTGIPVMPGFGEVHSREECAEKFGVNPRKLTMLVVGGAAGVGGLCDVVERLMAVEGDFQVIVLCGTNKRLLQKLRHLEYSINGRLFPVGFTKEPEKFLAVSDLVLTKPGGLTVSECMAMGKPMIIFAPIPGQEESNSEFLLSNGIALRAYSPEELTSAVTVLLAQPGLMEQLAANSAEHGKPAAAKDIINIILNG